MHCTVVPGTIPYLRHPAVMSSLYSVLCIMYLYWQTAVFEIYRYYAGARSDTVYSSHLGEGNRQTAVSCLTCRRLTGSLRSTPATGLLIWCNSLPFGYVNSPLLFCSVTEAIAQEFRKRTAGRGIAGMCSGSCATLMTTCLLPAERRHKAKVSRGSRDPRGYPTPVGL